MNRPLVFIVTLLGTCFLLRSAKAQESSGTKTVTIAKADDLLRRIHHGNDTVYVVNFWATWCKPCVAELPEFETFAANHRGEKVCVILVSLDFREDLEKRLLPFLQKHRYTSEVWLLDESNGNDFIDRIDRRWSGAIPATLMIFGRKEAVFIEEKISAARLEVELTK